MLHIHYIIQIYIYFIKQSYNKTFYYLINLNNLRTTNSILIYLIKLIRYISQQTI